MTTEHVQPDPPTEPPNSRRFGVVLAYLVMAIAVTGYYIGVTAPMPEHDSTAPPIVRLAVQMTEGDGQSHEDYIVAATAYSDIPQTPMSPNANWTSRLTSLKQLPWDPFAEVPVRLEERIASLQRRAEYRAFNGAPPTVPHPIDQMSSNACRACHEDGLRSATLRASAMSHRFYTNCTQCHVESAARFAPPSRQFENEFTGLPAPVEAPRAFAGAPPVIPHATWMRENCLSCHGRTARPGLQTTHAWRTNCQQCHAPQAAHELMPLISADSGFLPTPVVDEGTPNREEE